MENNISKKVDVGIDIMMSVLEKDLNNAETKEIYDKLKELIQEEPEPGV